MLRAGWCCVCSTSCVSKQEELSFTVDCFRSMVNIMLVEKVNADEAARLDWVQDD